MLVVGAGRGPLVQAALNAAIVSNVDVQVWAVEKNFNAVVTLRNRFKQQLQTASGGLSNTVSVLYCDMRDLRSRCPDLSADIIVSELLGSWGDNEVSARYGGRRFLEGRRCDDSAELLLLRRASELQRIVDASTRHATAAGSGRPTFPCSQQWSRLSVCSEHA